MEGKAINLKLLNHENKSNVLLLCEFSEVGSNNKKLKKSKESYSGYEVRTLQKECHKKRL